LIPVAVIAALLIVVAIGKRFRKPQSGERSDAGSTSSLLSFEEISGGSLVLFAFVFAAGVAVAIAPVTLRNLAVSGEPILISSHAGLNFLVGNGPGADGTYPALDGITPSIQGQTVDSRKVAEAALGRKLTTREVSGHFMRLALDWIRAHPADA